MEIKQIIITLLLVVAGLHVFVFLLENTKEYKNYKEYKEQIRIGEIYQDSITVLNDKIDEIKINTVQEILDSNSNVVVRDVRTADSIIQAIKARRHAK